MLPLLKYLGDKEERGFRDVIAYLSSEFRLTEQEKQELLPSGRQSIIDNRISWAKTCLAKAKLVESPRRGRVRITPRGLDLLSKGVDKIDTKFLEQFPEFVEFRAIKKEREEKTSEKIEKLLDAIAPSELIEEGHNSIQASLGEDLLTAIRKSSPSFFEEIVLKLLQNMGYGKGEVTGRSGDGGIDGYIYQDNLGLDRILVQAKRFGENTPVSPSMLRDFIGTLTMNAASKGVFITTSRLPRDADGIISRCPKPIKLIDAPKLVKLMIEFNVGVSREKIYEIKSIDSDFFSEE